MSNSVSTQFVALIFVLGCVCAFAVSWAILKILLRIRAKNALEEETFLFDSNIPQLQSVWRHIYASGKTMAVLCLVAVLVTLHFLTYVFFAEQWMLWRDHAILFWGFNLAFVIVGFLAFGGFRYSKVLAWVFGALAFIGLWSHFSETHTYKEWYEEKRASNAPVASATVSRPVELPRGTLKCEPGPEIQAITGWPPMYELEIRNIDILDGAYINFDLWKEGIGKYGEYRWDKDVSPRNGRFTRCDKPVTGTWRLTEKLPPTARYSMILKGSHKADGAVHDEPMTLYVKVQ